MMHACACTEILQCYLCVHFNACMIFQAGHAPLADEAGPPLPKCCAGMTSLRLTSLMLWRRARTARMSWQSESLTPQVSCLHHSSPEESHTTKCKDRSCAQCPYLPV